MGWLGRGAACGLVARGARGRLLGATALTLGLLGSSGAQAQVATNGECTVTGSFAAAGPEVATIAAMGNTLGSVIDTMNTAFLAQGSAFVGSPPSPVPDQTVGGVWIRGIGGRIDSKSTLALNGTVDTGQGPDPGGATCNTKVRQDFGGVQVGQDIATLNVGGTGKNVHFGITAGYGESHARDLNGSGTTATVQVPFVGVYSVLTWGNFFFDILSRWDFYHAAINNSAVNVVNEGLDARGVSTTVSAGYRIDVGNNWFVEPSAAVIHSRVQVDTFNLAGTGITGGFVPPLFIHFNDIESTLGRAGVRVGTSFTTGNVALQPFVTASVWHEFERPTTTFFQTLSQPSSTGCSTTFPCINGTTSTTRVGTYGQYSLGLAAQIINTGWLGYARVDVREGPKIEGVSVNGGIRYQFNPEAPVQAAGIFKAPVHVPKGAVGVPYDWTGFYFGGFLGSAWGESKWENVDNFGVDTFVRPRGILGGGQAGYNFQTGPWVFGVEGDFGWTNAKGTKSFPDPVLKFFLSANQSADWIATATARLGYAWNRALLYVKGGGAWIRNNYSITDNTGGLFQTPEFAADTRTGLTVGAGLEFGLAPNWSAKVEYDYLDFGSRLITIVGTEFIDTANIKERVHEVKIGVNYRFGGPGLVAVAAPVAAAFPTKAYPTKAPPLVPSVAAFNWRGCYVGVTGGGAWGRSKANNDGTDGPVDVTGNFDVRGAIFGGTSGCNLLQAGNWVFGVESDFSWTSKKGTAHDTLLYDPGQTFLNETRENWLSTSRARVGYAWNNWLLYATAGAAVGDVTYTVSEPTLGAFPEKHTRAGWTAGAGIEWAFDANWSAKLEYLFVDFGREGYFDPPPRFNFVNRAGGVFLTDNIVRAGVNWRFNWGKAPAPVVAKY